MATINFVCYRSQSRAALGKAAEDIQRGDKTDYFNITAWEKTAEFIKKYFVKGSRIIIEGHLQPNNYTDANGVKHYGLDIIVDGVEFGGSKK